MKEIINELEKKRDEIENERDISNNKIILLDKIISDLENFVDEIYVDYQSKKKNSKIISKPNRPKHYIKYTKEQIKYLTHLTHLSDDEIIEEFNKQYGTDIKKGSRQLYVLMQREGIRSKSKVERIKNKHIDGIRHFSKRGKYLCNPFVFASEEKLTDDWDEVTCNNCESKRNQVNKKDTDLEISEFIKKNERMETHELRDEIIERFGVNIKLSKIRLIILRFANKTNDGDGKGLSTLPPENNY